MYHYSFWDKLIVKFDETLHVLNGMTVATRPSPSDGMPEPALNSRERRHASGLMRVNHVGEVCAQALYRGQAMASRSPDIQKKLQQAAEEEADHLFWCQRRLKELNASVSSLNPLWYTGAWLIGFTAGLFGDKASLSFLAATEHQVEEHLSRHLDYLPDSDQKSRAIVEQMRLEEMEHATIAEQSGAIPLPLLIQWGMWGLARLMTVIAYRL